jgi:hypothetical protein
MASKNSSFNYGLQGPDPNIKFGYFSCSGTSIGCISDGDGLYSIVFGSFGVKR